MSDPSAQEDPTPPPQPPRPNRHPSAGDRNTTTPRNQLEADELYARQLAEHYGGAASYRRDPRSRGDRGNPPQPVRRSQTGLKPSELYEDDHSFLEGRRT